MEESFIWKARKRNSLGLPWTFTVYILTTDKFFINKGFFNKVQEEIRLYRLIDFTLKRSLAQRIFGIGTIHCCARDQSTPEFNIINIKNSEKVMQLLSDTVEECRKKNGFTVREFLENNDECEES